MATINKASERVIATVVSNKRVGQYHQILLNVGQMVNGCKPGNFVAIKVGGENSRMVLRRAFAISRVSLTTVFAIIIGILYFKEKYKIQQLIGIIVTIFGIYLATFDTV